MICGGLARAVLLALAFSPLLTGCQNMPAAEESGRVATVGSTTITTSGRVRMDGSYVD